MAHAKKISTKTCKNIMALWNLLPCAGINGLYPSALPYRINRVIRFAGAAKRSVPRVWRDRYRRTLASIHQEETDMINALPPLHDGHAPFDLQQLFREALYAFEEWD